MMLGSTNARFLNQLIICIQNINIPGYQLVIFSSSFSFPIWARPSKTKESTYTKLLYLKPKANRNETRQASELMTCVDNSIADCIYFYFRSIFVSLQSAVKIQK